MQRAGDRRRRPGRAPLTRGHEPRATPPAPPPHGSAVVPQPPWLSPPEEADRFGERGQIRAGVRPVRIRAVAESTRSGAGMSWVAPVTGPWERGPVTGAVGRQTLGQT
ncbi:hypothetical protein TPA0910_59160 [Streptomyces hygroscopicus subsp. sporocinereus]|uniref:Uncharacterized protein n=1 Tax=Streptomyces hygroscopicus TaxID=1912 RepID=A0ABQ3U799_STRHY|nr:hypothetical protein TPA0910_59160 [Streptomyces hygroscopicus]